jgi:hypothetical protein
MQIDKCLIYISLNRLLLYSIIISVEFVVGFVVGRVGEWPNRLSCVMKLLPHLLSLSISELKRGKRKKGGRASRRRVVEG